MVAGAATDKLGFIKEELLEPEFIRFQMLLYLKSLIIRFKQLLFL